MPRPEGRGVGVHQAAVEVVVANRTRQRLPLARLRRAARAATETLGYREARLGLLFVGDAAMRRLNERHRKHRGSTSVLSFSAASSDVLRRRRILWGDIVLCVPAVRREARTTQQAFEKRLALLLVHAMVHLAGYTHDSETAARRMEQIERRILAVLIDGNRNRISNF